MPVRKTSKMKNENKGNGKKYNKKYAWEEWFSKDVFQLTKGKEYHCTTASMAQQVRNRACLINKSIRISELDKDNGITVEIFESRRKYSAKRKK